MNILKLVEEKTSYLSRDKLDDSSALAIHHDYKNQIYINYPNPFNNFTYVIRSRGFVGYFPINENVSLQIVPKAPVTNIFRMLEYAYRLKSFNFLDGSISVESVEDIFERLVVVLSKRVIDRSRKGLYLNYLDQKESLPHLRGKMDMITTTFSLLRGSTRAICEYQELTADLEDNQILAWTLYQLRRFQIHREEVRNLTRKAFRELNNKVKIRQIDPQNCVNRFYHRLNLDYKPMHGLCRFFLEHGGPGIERGKYNFLPFVVHMPTLFESFIAEWLQINLPSWIQLQKQYISKLRSGRQIKF